MSSTSQLVSESSQSAFPELTGGIFPNLQVLLSSSHSLEEFLDIFFFETQPWLSYHGMTFTNEHRDINYNVGLDAPNRCVYRLFAHHNYLGDISFTREYRFEEDELDIIDELLGRILTPLSKVVPR